MAQTILVVDDHANVRTLIKEYLTELGYHVLTARDGVEALAVAGREPVDLILLDVMMPNLDGFAFLRAFRKERNVPIILLTARLAEADKVVGLELGADDYVTKPFGMQELVARIRAVLRRVTAGAVVAGESFRLGELLLNRRTHSVAVGGVSVNLTPSEFALLAALLEAPGRVFSRELLLERLQGNDYEGVERTVDVHIRNLRKKIEPAPTQPRYVKTVFGIGYRASTADEL
ncbi:MAG TPA: response regulator transcription factor [Roseiflexaceae bacterium]|nr:response regulator transcription factor [Roseiflexaceae bacterium]